jgi:uncharacterized membrane-anchored protein
MRIFEIIFSPTGGTQKCADIFAAAFGKEVELIDLADFSYDFTATDITSEDICIIAAPAFGGRIPEVAAARLKSIKGNGAKTILIASWNKEPSWDVYLAYYELIKTLSPEKQIKAIQKLISKNKEFRISMLALADIAIKTENWRLAKETLESYLQSYPLTKKVSILMAEVARRGWHHEQEAKEWEEKGLETDDKYGWTCLNCHQKNVQWHPTCPHCNKIGQIVYR